MHYYIYTFFNRIKCKKFLLSIVTILFSMAFSLTAFIEEGTKYFFEHDYVMTFLQGYNGDRTLFTILAPLIATIPFAAQHIENKKSGSLKYILMRMGNRKYFNSIFIINMLLSFVTFLVGMILYFGVSFVVFSKDVNMDIYYAITRVTTYEVVAKKSPVLYIGIIIIHCSLVAIAYSSVGLALSFFIKNKFIAWISPFIISTVGSLFAMFVGLTKIEPMAIFDVSRVNGIDVTFVLLYMMLVIFTSYIVAYNKFKRDMCVDEEI